jgi:hypothetical protein
MRQNNKNQGKKLNLVEASKNCSLMWKAMTPQEKEPYEKLYQLDMEKYNRDKEKINLEKNFGINQSSDTNFNNILHNFNDRKNNFGDEMNFETKETSKKDDKNTIKDNYNNFN